MADVTRELVCEPAAAKRRPDSSYAAQFSLHSFYFVTERPHDRFHSIANNLDFLGISICLAAGTGLAWLARTRRSRA